MENSQDTQNIIIGVKEEVEELKELIQSLIEKQEETIEYVQKNTENLIEVIRGSGIGKNEGSDNDEEEMDTVTDNKKMCEIGDTLIDVQKSVEEMRVNIEEISAHMSGVELSGEDEYEDDDEDEDSGDIKITGLVGGVIKYDKEEDYERVKKVVVKTGKASASFIQEKCNLSHGKTLGFIKMLEERGVVGPKKGTKPRPVLAEDDND